MVHECATTTCSLAGRTETLYVAAHVVVNVPVPVHTSGGARRFSCLSSMHEVAVQYFESEEPADTSP